MIIIYELLKIILGGLMEGMLLALDMLLLMLLVIGTGILLRIVFIKLFRRCNKTKFKSGKLAAKHY